MKIHFELMTNIYFVFFSSSFITETITDLTSFKPDEREHFTIEKRYNLLKSFQNVRDVGHLTVCLSIISVFFLFRKIT